MTVDRFKGLSAPERRMIAHCLRRQIAHVRGIIAQRKAVRDREMVGELGEYARENLDRLKGLLSEVENLPRNQGVMRHG